ncbi:MAG: biotin--[acetyl-CoA-carboxylase] ligase [Ruminococcaceae bacterium]|nr:biotin--[acetyl-CoA-carboxylase] ligase [Oscillospiraceae bacterium]MBQ3215610.1 biotin--[acetyl-CoA-carboxylase] ligase [Oscillospiraceae bacterium]
MIHRFETVDSTNIVAKAMALEGAAHGTVVLAEHQTAGRGRMGRSFHSPASAGIYMSVILRPSCPPTALMHLTCAVAVTACDAVEEALGWRPGIKWINDLVAGGKKLAGILTELHIDPKTGLVDFAIVGIGLNCNQQPEDFPSELRHIACSAAMISGHPIDREPLICAIIQRLQDLELEHKKPILQRYRSDCVTLGQEVDVIRGDSRRKGFALDVDSQGALVVRFEDGHTEAVDSGEVSIRGQLGYV